MVRKTSPLTSHFHLDLLMLTGNERCGLYVCIQSSFHHIYCLCPHRVRVGGVVPSEMLFCRPVVVTSKQVNILLMKWPVSRGYVFITLSSCMQYSFTTFITTLLYFSRHSFCRVDFACVPGPCLPWGWPAASSWIKVSAFADVGLCLHLLSLQSPS